jgi:hypothetical protein
MKSTIFWNITPCSPLSVNRRFGGEYPPHLQGRRNKFSKKPGVISQEMVLFITTAVKISNPKCHMYLLLCSTVL